MGDLVFSQDVRKLSDDKLQPLLTAFEQGVEELRKLSHEWEVYWEPADDPVKLHNHYIAVIRVSSVMKVSSLFEGTIRAVNDGNFLMYAIAARAIVEHTACLRHYFHDLYPPLLTPHPPTREQMQQLIELGDRCLRGSRFDWEGLFAGRPSTTGPENLPRALRVGEAIKKWDEAVPKLKVQHGYHLLCDCVHPNLGSTWLAAYVDGGRLKFARSGKMPAGYYVFWPTVPLMVSVFREFLDVLDLIPKALIGVT